MSLRNLIKMITAPHLEQYGFEYEMMDNQSFSFIKTEYPENLDTPEYHYTIQKHRYSKYKITFNYSVSGAGLGRSVRALGPRKEKYNHYLCENSFWHYTNEEELITILKEFNRLFDLYIYDDMMKMGIPDEPLYTTNRMEKDLYELHETYIDMEEFESKITQMPKEEFVKYLVKRIVDAKEKEIKKQKEILMEIASIWGKKLIYEFGGTWEFEERNRLCYLEIPFGNKKQYSTYVYPLTDALYCFRCDSKIEIEKSFETIWWDIEKQCKGIKDEHSKEIMRMMLEDD